MINEIFKCIILLCCDYCMVTYLVLQGALVCFHSVADTSKLQQIKNLLENHLDEIQALSMAIIFQMCDISSLHYFTHNPI